MPIPMKYILSQQLKSMENELAKLTKRIEFGYEIGLQGNTLVNKAKTVEVLRTLAQSVQACKGILACNVQEERVER